MKAYGAQRADGRAVRAPDVVGLCDGFVDSPFWPSVALELERRAIALFTNRSRLAAARLIAKPMPNPSIKNRANWRPSYRLAMRQDAR
jgi:hypothetical protein